MTVVLRPTLPPPTRLPSLFAIARSLSVAAFVPLLDSVEIGAGIDSGPEFARERLKLQVEVLQSSLMSGSGAGRGAQGGATAQLRDLCALPALVDARTASRIEQLALRSATVAARCLIEHEQQL